MDYKPVYLVMITTENNNKYYNCFPDGDSFTVKYGRVGGHESTKVYPISKWNSQISSKLKKGYIDRSELMEEVTKATENVTLNKNQDEFSSIKVESVKEIIKRLFNYANKIVKSSYKVTAEVVTQSMIDKAQLLIDNISNDYKSLTVNEFNEKLIELFGIIPRRMSVVTDYLASEKDSFLKIIEREQETLDAMRGQVYKPVKASEVQKSSDQAVSTSNILDKMGIIMEEASTEDIAKIKKAMGDASNKFYKAWKVTNLETEEKYRKFVKENQIGNIKLTCHGSRNQNWFNILKTGLKIRPAGVVTTGNMFGLGLYYSNPDKWHGVAKSIGYTSLGGYWTREQQDCGFIAFFETALGESYDVYSFNSKYYNFNLKALKKENPNAWNLFAHGGNNMLRNDEIIVYNDAQTTIRYLVEIR